MSLEDSIVVNAPRDDLQRISNGDACSFQTIVNSEDAGHGADK